MNSISVEDSVSLADSLRKLLQEHYDFAGARRHELAAGPDRLPSIWPKLLDLGLGSLLLPEAHGGFGGGPADLQRVQREFGRALLVSPWFDTALCTRGLLLGAEPAQQDALLRTLADGSQPMAFADAPGAEPVRARRTDRGWVLDGCRTPLLHADAVQRYLVSARLPDGQTGWFVVDAAQPAVRRTPFRLVDHSWAADVRFDAAAGTKLDRDVPPATLRATAVAGYCAEAQGMAEAALEATVQYLRTRRQFGQALGEYQALRHRVAEMYIALEQLRSAADLALEAALADAAANQERQAAQALLIASDAATWILQQAIQLHGGMGMTEELAVGHYYRRMLVINALSGGAPAALASLVRA